MSFLTKGQIPRIGSVQQKDPPAVNIANLALDFKGRTLTNPNRDFLLEVARKNVEGFSAGDKFGFNSDIGIGTEDIVSQGGTVNILSSGSQLAVKSSDVNDDAGDAGANTVKLFYLDTNFVEQNEIIIMNGQNLVNTVATNILRPFRMIVTSAGASLSNEGNIELVNTGDTLTFLQIDALENQTLSTFFTVPAGKTMYILDWIIASGRTGKEALCKLQATADNDGTNLPGLFATKKILTLTASSQQLSFPAPLCLKERVDIKVRATGTGANTPVSSSYCFVLVDNLI